jgi:hypothetical protein
MAKFTATRLKQLANLHDERYSLYGPNYVNAGMAMRALFSGNPPELKTASDHARMGLLVQIMSKLSRYCANFNQGGHEDSLDDLAVYSVLLQEVDKGETN